MQKSLFPGVFAACLLTSAAHAGDASPPDLSDLSLEALSNIEITSVSKKAEPISAAAAAVFVITQDDIRRSGATSVPEMLRLAPNLQVAKITARTYSITARGFGIANANKLLVLIDGRTVYSPLNAAVFWDSQEVMPEDVDRIEVISGPGGTLWGANAVNGVINIITRVARDTQGAVASVGAGNEERGARARYGGSFGETGSYRIYAKGFERDSTFTAANARVGDDWDGAQGGFRVDVGPATNAFTLQGDIYGNSITAGNSKLDGHNLTARWSRRWDSAGALDVQAYYDYTNRVVPASIGDKVKTYDIDIKHGFDLGERHDFVWGGGYRLADGRFSNVPQLFITPAHRDLKSANVFVQDSIDLSAVIKLTAGLKLEDSSYSGSELLPSIRLSWTASDTGFLWAGVSRAVRTPSRIDRDLFVPSARLIGNPAFDSETLVAYEVGYRGTLAGNANFSITGYCHVYDDLRSVEFTAPAVPQFLPRNGIEGDVCGVEAWGTADVADWWRLNAGVNTMHASLKRKPGSLDVTGVQALGNDPELQASLRSSMDLPGGLALDLHVRASDARPLPRVPGYVALDGRLAWGVTDNFELAVTGTNLTDRRHAEFGALPGRTALRRTFYLSATWTP